MAKFNERPPVFRWDNYINDERLLTRSGTSPCLCEVNETMKNLILLRHAKSSWDEPALSDFDRPLNNRGKKAAPIIGKLMKERQLKPDLILCSPSKRTKQTAKLVLDSAKLDLDVTFDKGIYEASTSKLLNILKSQEATAESILMIGHNPGLEDLLTELTGCHEHFPTAALANIVLDIENWKGIKYGAGELKWIVRPKEIS